MMIGLCIAGYLLAIMIFTFVFAYFNKTLTPSDQVSDFGCVVFALIWPISLLIMLGCFIIGIPLDLADRYARKHNLKNEESKS